MTRQPVFLRSIPKINLLARTIGFKRLKAEKFLTSNEPEKHNWNDSFVLKKMKKKERGNI